MGFESRAISARVTKQSVTIFSQTFDNRLSCIPNKLYSRLRISKNINYKYCLSNTITPIYACASVDDYIIIISSGIAFLLSHSQECNIYILQPRVTEHIGRELVTS